MKRETLPIFLVFFVMGFGDAVGALVGFVGREFELSRSVAGLLPFFGLLAYGLFSVPIGVLQDRVGKKAVLLVFLGVTLAGELLPVIRLAEYWHLLVAIFLIGLGMTGLQVAGNPAMRDVSAPGRYARNLTFAQFVKSLGSNSAPYVIPLIVTVAGIAWENIFLIYAVVVAVALAAVAPLPMKERPDERTEATASLRSSFALLKDPYVALMVLGIFLYVGAEVGLNSWIATYLESTFGLDIESLATLGIGFFLTSLAAGRLIGSMVLNFVSPARFFLASALLGLTGLAGLFVPSQAVVIGSILVAGLAFGNVFPLIFSMLIDRMPERANELSGLMVMAIVGGAIVPALMGVVADHSVRGSFLIPLAIFVYITTLAIINLGGRMSEGAR